MRSLPYTRNKGQPLFQADSQDTCNNNVIDTKILVFMSISLIYIQFYFSGTTAKVVICRDRHDQWSCKVCPRNFLTKLMSGHSISWHKHLSMYYWKVVIGGVTFHLCSPLQEDITFTFFLRFQIFFWDSSEIFFALLGTFYIFGQSCDYPIPIAILSIWTLSELPKDKNFAGLYTRFFWVTFSECSHGFWQLV